ncbi:hypothetical protein Tco_0001070 [Tanacetum coccineum]
MLACSDQDARYALSRLLQRGTVAEYESEFLMLIKRVTGISEYLLKSFYISGLKPLLQCALLRLAPTTLVEAFSIARIMEAHFETITGKKLNIEEKIDIVLSWPSEEAPPVIKWSLDANEDIGVVEVSSTIDDVFDIGESNVESMEVRSEFSEFSENKESVEEVVVGGGEALGVGEDDDTGNAATDGGDDAVESGDISILNSLIGHETRVLPNCGERSRLNDKYIKKNKMKVAIQRRLWGPGIQDEGVTPVLQEDERPKRPQREKFKPVWHKDYVI